MKVTLVQKFYFDESLFFFAAVLTKTLELPFLPPIGMNFCGHSDLEDPGNGEGLVVEKLVHHADEPDTVSCYLAPHVLGDETPEEDIREFYGEYGWEVVVIYPRPSGLPLGTCEIVFNEDCSQMTIR